MSARAAIPTGPRSRSWTPHGDDREELLSIAMLAPPWIAVPPTGYGGIEAVIDVLCDALVESGHSVTLFAAPGSHSRATVVPVLAEPHPEAIGSALFEADHVARAFEQIERAAASGRPFDVVHDHCGFTALAMADRITTPLVHTLHGPFTADTYAFYARHGDKAEIVAISQTQRQSAPPALRDARVIPNPIAVDRCAFRTEKDDYLLWLGRMDECKGPHRAIDVARLADRPIVIAGPVQPGQERFFEEQIEPRLLPGGGEYVGEVSGTPKQQLLARAAALLMPIRWSEPFGMVMIEALAAGTPVIAFPEGAATEIVIDGENGFLVADEEEMAEATARLHTIDPHRCRASVSSRYDGAVVARRYAAAYRAARNGAGPATLDLRTGVPPLSWTCDG
jgi:glycosyltransferase involved in cell wall biosynthesis